MDRGQVTLMRNQNFIFLLPIQKDNERHFDAWFKSVFSEEDSNRWLLGLKEEARKAVLNKEAIVGMTHEALVAALGEPNSLTKDIETADGRQITKEIATYAKQIVVLTNGVVSKIQVLTPSTPAQFQRVQGKRNG